MFFPEEPIEEPSSFEKLNEKVLNILTNIKQMPEAMQLYDHQIDALFAVRDYFKETLGPTKPAALVVAPTGAGKTGVVALLPYVLASRKALILSPSIKISDQLEKAFGLRSNLATESFVYERKIVPKDHLNTFLEKGQRIPDKESLQNMQKWNLIIVNIHKFGLLDDEVDEETRERIMEIKRNFSKFSTLIVDEAHHFPAKMWKLIVKEFEEKQVVFLTATPFKNIDLEGFWKNQAITYKISKTLLVNLNIIRKLDFKEILDCDVDNFIKIKDQILEYLKAHDEEEPYVKHKAMVLTIMSKDCAKEGARLMGDVATYHTSDKPTERNLRKFENQSDCKILFVCGKLTEGYDNSDVSVCVILRNVGSLSLFTQFVGRCVRRSKHLSKDQCDVTAIVASLPVYKQDKMFNVYMRD